MAFLELKNVCKGFGGPPVLQNVNLTMERGEFVAISSEPAVVGEALTLDLTADEAEVSLPVRVHEARQVVVDGALRHRLVLQPLEPDDAGPANGSVA